jgi:hypothetical protein
MFHCICKVSSNLALEIISQFLVLGWLHFQERTIIIVESGICNLLIPLVPSLAVHAESARIDKLQATGALTEKQSGENQRP